MDVRCNLNKAATFPEKEEKTEKGFFKSEKLKDVLLLLVLGLALFILVWKVFHDGDGESEKALSMTETEQKVARILQEIDGVGEANVLVCETEEEIVSVVVVCDGANDLQVIMDVREAVAAALGTQQKNVKIFLKKE